MKLRSLILALLICPGLLITPYRGNNVKACGTGTAPGGAMKKYKMLKMQDEYGEDPDVFLGLFMNPFGH